MKTSLMIKNEVDRLFNALPAGSCQNPVTGAWFVKGLDPLATQKRVACAALMAREWFAREGLPELQPLPINCDDIMRMKGGGGVRHMFGYYAQSVCCFGYAVEEHPSFDDYARGVMASSGIPWFFEQDEELRKRFPPRPLSGLNRSTLNWKPPKGHEQTIAHHRRSEARDGPLFVLKE
jgi:hypothetical protein